MAPETWKYGLFECFSDIKSCCLTFWCPCVTFGRIAEIVGQGTPSCCGAGAVYILLVYVVGCPPAFLTHSYRTKMRQQYTFDGSCCGDFLVHCFCQQCALCQEYRELQSRGFNMTIGWQGNVDEKNHEVGMGPMPPKVEEGMSRNK